jgi:hypothetical protein
MELSTTRETTGCAATREPPSILWNPALHGLLHSQDLSQTTPVNTTPSHLSKILLNIIDQYV